MENNTTWKKIYDLAGQIYMLKPWSFMFESDVFGVEIPGNNKQYFVSIMGSENVIRSVAAYEGPGALMDFWAMENSETADGSDLMSIPHLILTFENEKDIDKEQLKRFRSLTGDPGLDFALPELRYNNPGRYPMEPDDERLNEMIIILEQTLDVAVRVLQNEDLLLPDEDDEVIYLVRKLDPEINAWKDHYMPVAFPEVHYGPVNDEDIDEIIALPPANAVMQLHSQLMPMQVMENDVLYFSYIVIMVNKKSGRIENIETLIANPDFHSMLEKVPPICLRFIKSLSFRPRAIEVKTELLYDMLLDAMLSCDIRLNKYKELPAVSEAIKGIIEYSKK